MRWFTRQWQDGELSDDEAEARDPDYRTYIRSVIDRLPEHVRAFAQEMTEHMSVHDGLLDRATIDLVNRRIELVLLNGDLQVGYGKLRLEFLEADLIEPIIDQLQPLLSNPETEFIRQEVELAEGASASLELRFLLWPEGQIAIACRDIHVSWSAIEDRTRSDHRNEVLVLS